MPSFLNFAATRIAQDATQRCCKIASNLSHSLLGAIVVLLPLVSAQSVVDGGYHFEDEDPPNYTHFKAGPANLSDDDGTKALADINNFLATSIDWYGFKDRADQIRLTKNREYCVGNLSLALSGLGAAYQAGASGATTLLTLLPTAGALIGTPTKELWILYKLMPIAGLASMVLSLGGNIVPQDINDYEHAADQLNYSGMIASAPNHQSDEDTRYVENPDEIPSDIPEREKDFYLFANRVAARARDRSGSRKTGVICFGIFAQLSLIGCILTACWFMQSGSIIVWWCTFKPYMWSWYAFVALSSIVDSIAGVPFTHQWTIRVSRAPKVTVSPDAPVVVPMQGESFSTPQMKHRSDIPSSKGKGPTGFLDEPTVHVDQVSSDRASSQSFNNYYGNGYSAVPQHMGGGRESLLAALHKGYNTFGKVAMDPGKPWSAADNAFYVIISVRGVSHPHALLRVVSKLLSIGVYTVGTAMFASATLATILVAVVVASMIIVSGVFGRVFAMWMTSELMKNQPLLHRVAKNHEDAERYIEAMLRKPDMVFEIMNHVITEGRCIKRLSLLRWSRFLGVLAPPFDVTKLAVNPGAYVKA